MLGEKEGGEELRDAMGGEEGGGFSSQDMLGVFGKEFSEAIFNCKSPQMHQEEQLNWS